MDVRVKKEIMNSGFLPNQVDQDSPLVKPNTMKWM